MPFQHLAGKRIFITGGTGFLGRSLLDYLASIEQQYSLNFCVDVLSRDPDLFLQRFPYYADYSWLSLIKGSLDNLPQRQKYSYLIHGAADTHCSGDPLTSLNLLVQGTHKTLKFAYNAEVQKLVFISSGAVYGSRSHQKFLEEDQNEAPVCTDISKLYGHGKRMAETLCSLYSSEYGVPSVIARCFSVVSEHVPLDGPYAIGNFIRDAMDSRCNSIIVRGNGKAVRTYLDGRDMAYGIMTLLERGKLGYAYNLGNDQPITTLALAELVSQILCPDKPVEIKFEGDRLLQADRSIYVPSIDRLRRLGFKPSVSLPDAIEHAANKIYGCTSLPRVF